MTFDQATGEVNLRRLYWVGPATVAVSVVAVRIVQEISLAILPPLPRFSEAVLNSNEPAVVTAVLVTAAAVTFAVVVDLASNPLRTFRRLALGVLLVSFVPNVVGAQSEYADWPSMIALMAMHVVAWAVTVTMLTRLTVTTVEGQREVAS